MSLTIGGINLFQQGLDNEYRTLVLEKIIEKILSKNPNLLSDGELDQAREEAFTFLQNKYPEAGIKKVEKK